MSQLGRFFFAEPCGEERHLMGARHQVPRVAHTQATMIQDSTSCRVFKITELTRTIASQLVLISLKSTVDLACSSWYLEEPVLSTLWETQSSLCTLLKVLPQQTWRIEPRWCAYTVHGLDPPSEKLNAGAYGHFS